MKKFLLKTIFIVALLALFPLISEASDSSLHMNSLNFEAQIHNNGSMTVCEYWNIDIEETNTLFKNFKQDSTKFSSITDVQVSQISSDKTIPLTQASKWAYHMQNNTFIGTDVTNNKFEIAWGVGLDDSSATRLYKVEYTVNDVISTYSDCSELYWQFVGNEFEIDTSKISGTILLPQNCNSKDDIKVWGHTKNLNGTIYATDLNKINFDVSGLISKTFLEVRIAFPSSMVTVSPTKINNNVSLASIIAQETTWANEANQKRTTKIGGFLAIAVLLDLFLIYLFAKHQSTLKAFKENYIEVPELDYFRDIPDENSSPADALKLQKKLVGDFPITDFGNIFSATLLNLHLKGFITIELDEKKKTLIKFNTEKNIETNSSNTEKEIYKFIHGATSGVSTNIPGIIQDFFDKDQDDNMNDTNSNSTISLKDLQKYIENHQTKIEKLRVSINSQTEENVCKTGDFDLSQKKIYTKHSVTNIIYAFSIMLSIFLIVYGFSINLGKVVLFGYLSTIVLSIVNIIQTSLILKNINIFTQTGKQHCAEWNGLKKFMEDFSMLDKREIPEIVLWEKYLVFATVFNVADKVIKQLKIVYPELQDSNFIQNYAFLHIMTSTNFSHDFSRSINTSISSAYSSGSGAGGGFSGGGGFGGGRRWRRRTLKLIKVSRVEFYVNLWYNKSSYL